MDMEGAKAEDLVPHLLELAQEQQYTKIFAKVPCTESAVFVASGFEIEATVPKLYQGAIDGHFLGLFLDKRRREEKLVQRYDEVAALARSKEVDTGPYDTQAMRICTADDASVMAALYCTVFDSYPFPIDDPAFITSSMEEGTIYAGLWEDETLVALASAECNFSAHARYAEMTDFATFPDSRGNGYASHLLAFLEQEVHNRGIKTLYTIARAISPGMNCTFAKGGYTLGGRLKNNTQIAGTIESMHVWYKC
jgi:putative beta-lysine N-acetyltransferase